METVPEDDDMGQNLDTPLPAGEPGLPQALPPQSPNPPSTPTPSTSSTARSAKSVRVDEGGRGTLEFGPAPRRETTRQTHPYLSTGQPPPPPRPLEPSMSDRERTFSSPRACTRTLRGMSPGVLQSVLMESYGGHQALNAVHIVASECGPCPSGSAKAPARHAAQPPLPRCPTPALCAVNSRHPAATLQDVPGFLHLALRASLVQRKGPEGRQALLDTVVAFQQRDWLALMH